ncbi:unnamed protein product, partial [marine sediment metagenome]
LRIAMYLSPLSQGIAKNTLRRKEEKWLTYLNLK